MCDVAFLVMDLDVRGRSDLACRFLSAYLETNGDYEGLRLLPYFCVYRSLVRAKVACVRGSQHLSPSEAEACRSRALRHVALAESYARPASPLCVLMHGLAGSGKTRVSEALCEVLPALRIRSDVERKRGAGLPALHKTNSKLYRGLYSAAASGAVYERLAAAAAAARALPPG